MTSLEGLEEDDFDAGDSADESEPVALAVSGADPDLVPGADDWGRVAIGADGLSKVAIGADGLSRVAIGTDGFSMLAANTDFAEMAARTARVIEMRMIKIKKQTNY
ncbi:hypothetical protein IW147_002503 [Coemansia sp. RSA 720]|nr:hypothetical protein IW147_002503 [Coemansia sp. RSA 720]